MSELVMGTGLTAQQSEYLRILRSSASSLAQLINDLLDVSQVASGNLTLKSEPFELRDALNDALDMVSAKAYDQGLELSLRVAPDVPDHLTGDALRLNQVILNLLSNAIKFTSEGSVSLDVICTDLKADHSQPCYETSLTFTVSDTGIGIHPEQQQSIFTAFQRSENSSTQTHEGAGLGLAISQQLILLMGGRIWVEDRQPQGSRFHFTVKVMARRDERPVKQQQLTTLADHSVLIIDRDDMNRRSLVEMLNSWKMKPVCADTLSEALTKLHCLTDVQPRFSLVFLGVGDTTPDSDDRIRQIRSTPTSADVPIIAVAPSGQFFTGCDTSDRIAFLPKPIRKSQLLESMVEFLSPSSTRDTTFPDNSDSGPRVQLKILVAEDSIPNQKIISLMLEKAGHTVTLVSNGRDAVSRFAATAYDIILMDIQMPDMDGLQATIEIRKLEQKNSTHVPIVGVTGHATDRHLEEARRAGMSRFVIKPFTSEELLAALI